jgi:bifunctional UDP-N-acetylglucosamine pyrophosphorylase / glucosamine-1-phosphate N-acetyltransferase
MNKQIKAVVLAAGKSKRMKSRVSKVIHRILGKEIINYLLDSLVEVGIPETDIIVVCGENLPEVKAAVNRKVCYAVQEEQLGTAHALLSARDYFHDFSGDLLVTVGDNPYISASELQKLLERHRRFRAQCTFISALFPFKPPPYGRVIRNGQDEVTGVVEESEATPEQLEIREVNSGIYLMENPVTYPLLRKIDNQNAKAEYYLTDLVKLLRDSGRRIDAVIADDYYISIGINNRWELQEAQEKFNRARLQQLALEGGVTVLQPETVTVEYDAEIGSDTIIYPSTYIASGTRIGRNCRIGPFVYLSGVEVKDNEILQPGKYQSFKK